MGPLHAMVFGCVAAMALAQSGGDGMSKNTYNVADPKKTLAFMESFFPCIQAGWTPECECADGSYTCCPCGGRWRMA